MKLTVIFKDSIQFLAMIMKKHARSPHYFVLKAHDYEKNWIERLVSKLQVRSIVPTSITM
jgi:hypothetical protein